MHYKTLKFSIKIPLNIHNFHFLRRALREKLDIGTLRAKRAEKFGIFLTFTPPPPPPHPKKWIDAAACPPLTRYARYATDRNDFRPAPDLRKTEGGHTLGEEDSQPGEHVRPTVSNELWGDLVRALCFARFDEFNSSCGL